MAGIWSHLSDWCLHARFTLCCRCFVLLLISLKCRAELGLCLQPGARVLCHLGTAALSRCRHSARCSPCQTADLAMTGIYLSYLLQRVELLTYFPNFCILIIIQRRLFSITRGWVQIHPLVLLQLKKPFWWCIRELFSCTVSGLFSSFTLVAIFYVLASETILV